MVFLAFGRCERMPATNNVSERCCRELRQVSEGDRSEGPQRWPEGGFWSSSRLASGQKPGSLSPLSARGTVVCPDDGAVDHLQRVAAPSVGESGKHQVPNAAYRPTAELAMHQVPVAQFLRQVAPRRARAGMRAIQKMASRGSPMVTRRPTAQRPALRHERLKESALLVAQPSRITADLPHEDQRPITSNRVGGIPFRRFVHAA